ncbi:MAG: bifunctional 3-phosphoshikimate 1-carboxyvinyltransferase/cytidylate kinase [Brachymonas sp.]|nr:bifunctional 3-phosphoshikimate 1-carboxyvinyltransferase/cytidylate kinase [Brachymonas sp.]
MNPNRPAYLDIPPLQSASGTVVLPGSKSISNRVLLLAALCEGRTTLHDVLDSDDTRVMLAALPQIGCKVERDGNTVQIDGTAGHLPEACKQAQAPVKLFLGNAGTAMRPLTAALALLDGHFVLSGIPRMHERPIGDLVDGLRQLGAQIGYAGQEGYPPLQINPRSPALVGADGNLRISVRGDVSSQFLTALLLAAPLAGHTLTVEVQGELISKPYIGITLAMMQRFGVTVQRDAETGWQQFTVSAGSRYQSPGSLHVEADASSASYFIALGAIAANPAQKQQVVVQGLGTNSIQGDIAFIDAARSMGAEITATANSITIARGAWPLRAVDMDCNHIPDAAMTLAVMALYAEGTTTLRNIGSWRVKETDRIAAMATELRKLGATVEAGADFIRITPPADQQAWKQGSIQTYDDHRMAMCFALAAFNPAGLPVRIEDPACVDKTFPTYFPTLFGLTQAQTLDIPVLCIDGPSASGKGTLASTVAQQLGYHWLDSGALYRIAALAARRAGLAIDPANETAIAVLAATLPVRFATDELGGQQVWLGNDNVTSDIRTAEAGVDASKASVLPEVRKALLALQHSFRRAPGLVADGRDMGTVIFPDAQLKVFLTADAEERAQRRHKQLICQGFSANIDSLRADLQARDARDRNRAASPLLPAPDALLLDNSTLDVPASVQQVLAWWQDKQPVAPQR